MRISLKLNLVCEADANENTNYDKIIVRLKNDNLGLKFLI